MKTEIEIEAKTEPEIQMTMEMESKMEPEIQMTMEMEAKMESKVEVAMMVMVAVMIFAVMIVNAKALVTVMEKAMESEMGISKGTV